MVRRTGIVSGRALLPLALLATMAACAPPGTATVPVSSEGPSEPAPAPAAEPRMEGSTAVVATAQQGADAPADGSAEQVAEAAAAPLGPDGQTARRCDELEVPRGMSCIPGGWFDRGLAVDEHGCEQMGQPRDLRPMAQPLQRVWLQTFAIDRTEVTYAAYQACVAAGDCPRARPLYRGFSSDEQPMTGVSWFDARTFCQAQGGDLPTEAQWEAAARGPEGDWYPWGMDEGTCELAIVMNDEGRSCGREQRSETPDRGVVWPVASRPAGRYGLFDMAGNAEEWVLDWWTPDYDACGDACSGAEPLGPCDGAEACPRHRYRVVKGGSWYWDGTHATGWHRRRHEPDNDPFHHFGFRCVRRLVGDATSAPAP